MEHFKCTLREQVLDVYMQKRRMGRVCHLAVILQNRIVEKEV